MKNTHFILAILLTIIGVKVSAQTDQITALKNISEKTEFVQCTIDWTSDGSIITYPKSELKVLSYKNNDIGETGSFYLSKSYIAKKEADPAQQRPNHPTKPSIFYSSFTGIGSVIIGTTVYEFKRNKLENLQNGNFTIKNIYEVASDDSKVLKKQLKGKSSNLLEADHNKLVKEYILAMKAIQNDASNNMSDEEMKKAAKAKRIQEEKERKRMVKVSADFNAGKEATPVKVAFKNNTAKNICIVEVKSNKDVTTHTVKANDQDAWGCSSTYFYATDKYGYCNTTEDFSWNSPIVSPQEGCNQTILIK